MPVAVDPEYADIEALLYLARREINRQEPDQAIAQLRSVRDKIDRHERTSVWSEYALLLAEAYAAKNDRAAEDFFEDALSRVARVPDANAELRFRIHRSYGAFFSRRKLWAEALRQYRLAERLAIECGMREESAEVSLKIVEAQLQINKHPQLGSLYVLRRVGYRRHCTAERLLSTWQLHQGRSDEVQAQSIFLRHTTAPSEAYFEELIDEADREPDEE
jgi:tetratricopeptide (TPR) repeat protein